MNKNTKYWAFTWETNIHQKKLPSVAKLKTFLNQVTEYNVFQTERGEKKQKLHYQGVFTLFGPRQSKIQVLNLFRESFGNIAGLTLSKVHDKLAIMKYVTKKETRVDGPYYGGKFEKFDEKMSKMKLLPWQEKLYEFLLQTNKDQIFRQRKIIWLEDQTGNSGKSELQKWLRVGQRSITARKLPVSSVDRLISAVSKVVNSESVELFMIDLTRTRGETQSYEDLFAAIEDIKNGYLVDTMYGKYNEVIFDRPLIIIFSNKPLSDFSKFLSSDRWHRLVLNSNKELEHWEFDSHGYLIKNEL